MVNDVVERDPSVNGVRYGQYGGSIMFLSTWSFQLIYLVIREFFLELLMENLFGRETFEN